MPDLTVFALAVLGMLAMPGPTNTLLMTGGSVAGWRALALLPAELIGYLVAVLGWHFAIAPMAGHGTATTIIKLAAGLYLLFVASRVWFRDASIPTLKNRVVRLHEVGIVTLLNPKALIFALLIAPSAQTPIGAYMLVLALLVPLIGGGWIALGVTFGRALPPRLVQRIGAAVTGLFATVFIAATIG